MLNYFEHNIIRTLLHCIFFEHSVTVSLKFLNVRVLQAGPKSVQESIATEVMESGIFMGEAWAGDCWAVMEAGMVMGESWTWD